MDYCCGKIALLPQPGERGAAPRIGQARRVSGKWVTKSGRDGSMSKPAVIIVGADKGGVGKTTVTRTLLDYFNARKIPTRAFDTEAPKGTLKRFHPDVTD